MPQPPKPAPAAKRPARVAHPKERRVAPSAPPAGAPVADQSKTAATAALDAAASEPGRGTGTGTGTGAGRGSGSGYGSGHGEGGDLRAFCLSCPKPQYPRLARRRGWEGTVDVDVALASDGNVKSASVVTSSGYEALDDAALTAARQSRFRLANASDHTLRGRIAYGFRLSAGGN